MTTKRFVASSLRRLAPREGSDGAATNLEIAQMP